ncbi:DUF4833 domain-containing protein [Shimia sp. R9_2]|uniref:DUF4833 domain-containing protein n=1 Tax=Shimia sp. R9_2 TaxID=2821112 RepID=UPI001AD9E56D|nr:DUF4833 domain-containing protein [Shimia sp. R9_2]MBO9395508.1 DUF4833 domain-containing protein [Shimia sp. R9_2]
MYLTAHTGFQGTSLTHRNGSTFAMLLAFFAAFCLTLQATAAKAKPQLALTSSEQSDVLPLANPDFPHPDEPGQLFFLQRNMNANTVVYSARFDDAGSLIEKSPVSVFWRRYADEGQTMALRWYERVFGFGVRLKSHASTTSRTLAFNALKSQKLELRQIAPFKAALFTEQDGREYQLIYGYLDVDESGLLPKVTRLRLYTTDPQTGLYVTHTIAVSGGAFNE